MVSPSLTCITTSLPSITPPGPTATIFAICCFSCEAVGSINPLAVFSSVSRLYTTTLSNKGLTFILSSPFCFSTLFQRVLNYIIYYKFFLSTFCKGYFKIYCSFLSIYVFSYTNFFLLLLTLYRYFSIAFSFCQQCVVNIIS